MKSSMAPLDYRMPSFKNLNEGTPRHACAHCGLPAAGFETGVLSDEHTKTEHASQKGMPTDWIEQSTSPLRVARSTTELSGL